MPPVTETELNELKEVVLSLREEMRIGFTETRAELRSEIQRVEAKVDVAFTELRGDIKVLEERTRLGFWGFTLRGAIIGILGLLATTALSAIPEIVKRVIAAAGQ